MEEDCVGFQVEIVFPIDKIEVD